MHELLLFGRVPVARHSLAVSALAGLTGLQPQPLAERHLLFRPQRDPGTPPDRATAKRATELGVPPAFVNDTFVVQAIGNLAAPPKQDGAATQTTGAPVADSEKAAADEDRMLLDGVMPFDDSDEQKEARAKQTVSNDTDFERFPWTIEFRELPAVPGRTDTATKRAMFDVQVPRGSSPVTFLQNLGYRYSSEYMFQGHRFTHSNIDVRLFRSYSVNAQPNGTNGDAAPVIALDCRSLFGGQQPALEPSPPLQLLDKSGHYVLQARIFIREDSNPDVMSTGFAEMGKLRETLRGCIDLELGDRLAMNTRIR